MAHFENVYKIVEGIDHSIVHLNAKEIPQVVPDSFLEFAKIILQQPTNLFINLFLAEYIPLTWTGIFSILNVQLNEANKIFALIYPNEKLKDNCPHTDFTQYRISTNIQSALNTVVDLQKNPRPAQRSNFVRSFVNATLNTLFIQANTPLVRQKIFIKKDPIKLKKFQGDMAGTVFVHSDNFFYSFAISCSKNTYLKIISSMLKEENREITADNSNGLAEIVNIVIGQVKKLQTDDFKLNCSIPKIHMDSDAPADKVVFQDKQFTTYNEGEALIIPFQSTKGELFVEIWYRKEFESFLVK